MGVISSSLILADVADYARNPIIGWHNVVTVANITAETAEVANPVTNLANPATYPGQRWVGADTTEQDVTVSSLPDGYYDYVGVAGHNFGTAGIAVSVLGRLVSGGSLVELTDPRIPPDDAPLIFRYASERYFDIVLRMASGTEAPEAAVLHVGKLLVLERSIKINAPHTPFQMGIVSRELNGKSQNGHYLGSVELNRFNESVAQFEWFRPSWYRTNFHPFIVARQPFFFAWNPVEYPLEVGYAWLTDNPQADIDPVTRYVAISLKMEGVV